jgi:hypothetical protein
MLHVEHITKHLGKVYKIALHRHADSAIMTLASIPKIMKNGIVTWKGRAVSQPIEYVYLPNG